MNLSRPNSHESRRDSCAAILHYLKRSAESDGEAPSAFTLALLKDLCWKIRDTEPVFRAAHIGQAALLGLHPKFAEVTPNRAMFMEDFRHLASSSRRHFDVGIITVLDVELRAVLYAFGAPVNLKPIRKGSDAKGKGYDDFYFEIDDNGVRRWFVVRYVAEAQNVPTAIATVGLIRDYHINLAMLIGVAAGPKSKVKPGDVVFVDKVWDYEGARREKFRGKSTDRPRTKQIDEDRIPNELIESFPTVAFRTFIGDLVEGLISHRDEWPQIPSRTSLRRSFDFHRGIALAGEKLLADGSLPKAVNEIDQKIRACDMEDSGFSQACRAHGMTWGIFRGISDHGDPSKPRDDNWHFIASVFAAAAAKTFLSHKWFPSHPNLTVGSGRITR